MRVLLCDDEAEVVDLVKDALEKIDCDVVVAHSGYTALSLLKESVFDVVITDYWMQKGDGGMLASYCQEHNIMCVIMTGFIEDDVAHYLPEATPITGKIELVELLFKYQDEKIKGQNPFSSLFKKTA